MKKQIFSIFLLLYLVGCDKIPTGIVDPSSNTFQAISIIAPEVFVYNLNDSSFITSVKLKSISNISDIWLDFYSSDDKKINKEKVILLDNGNLANGDSIKDDNIFSARLSLSKYNPIGIYRLEYYISDTQGNTTKLGTNSFNYYNGQANYPPVISNLSAPDSIVLNGAEQLLNISVKVIDYNGLSDIKQVYFNSFIPPNGRPSLSNPILMYDDGTHGDVTANDGKYTVTVLLPGTGVTKGLYRWEYQAIDRSDSLSNKIIHYLNIR
jgi:hypothetical protein